MSAAQLALFAGGFAAGMVFLALVLVVAGIALRHTRKSPDDPSCDIADGDRPAVPRPLTNEGRN